MENKVLTTSATCPLGSYQAHTWNYERTECIWCGPNLLATKPGRWISTGDGYSAWSVDLAPAVPPVPSDVGDGQ